MSEFDEFSHDYQSKLEDSVKGLGSVDSALGSKLHILRRITAAHSLPSGSRILDFGCGTGLLTDLLQQLSPHVTGVDVSKESLRHSVSPASDFVLFDGYRLPFSDGSFNLVVASCVFHHISQDRRPEILDEINRILSLNGILVIIEHNPYNPVTRFVVNRCEFDKNAELLTMSLTKKLLESRKYENCLDGYFYAVPPVNGPLAFIDSGLSIFPLGAQYYCVGRKAGGEQPAGVTIAT